MAARTPVLRRAHLTYAADGGRGCWWLLVPSDEFGPAEDHRFAPGVLPPSEAARGQVLAGWGLRPKVGAARQVACWEWSEIATDDPSRSRLYAGLWLEPAPPAPQMAGGHGDEHRCAAHEGGAA